ncbi:hypothetical protein HJC23_008816 [Cyclotella cryptica]|uniref:RBR-type E3 ubiquitin transferase n=1 Tax=Cyclotella cryptica TaxID=29204 RepID=A0ABD3Q954_9STRA|eukprot:CCRYP_007461-RA/>CCRYP_007461-RA protein AED:0.10 eAED:0.10 QI:418/-1/1/1/-1/1/1/80/603
MSEDVFRSSPASWSVEEVGLWAANARLPSETITALLQNEVDGPTLITLSKSDLQSELGISSLPARRYLWELLKSVKSEQQTSDLTVALDVHDEEIHVLADKLQSSYVDSKKTNADAGSGDSKNNDAFFESMTLAVNETTRDVRARRQMLEDRLYAYHVQRKLNFGHSVCEDAELAHREQERLNALLAQSELDREYAETLATGRELATLQERRRQAEAASGLEDRNNTLNIGRVISRVACMFGLSVQNCAANETGVAEALRSGKVRPIPVQDVTDISDDEGDLDGIQNRTFRGETDKSLEDLPEITQCSACYEEHLLGYEFACSHSQCTQCARKLFKTALRDTTLLPLRCCDILIDMNIASQLLDPSDARLIVQRTEERAAKNKMYCPTCSAFLNLDVFALTLDSNEVVCDCGTALCIQCKTTAHPSTSCVQNLRSNSHSEDSDLVMLALSREQGWKQCPNCSIMIELRSGCNHMSCTSCSHEFCYRCLQSWSTRDAQCSSGQCELWDEDRLLEAGELRVQQEEAQRGHALPQALRRERLQHAVAGLRSNEICVHEWTRSNGYKGDCVNCGFVMWAYGMRCRSDCGSTVCYTCAHHRIPRIGWR